MRLRVFIDVAIVVLMCVTVGVVYMDYQAHWSEVDILRHECDDKIDGLRRRLMEQKRILDQLRAVVPRV